jgi:hypothetical protein
MRPDEWRQLDARCEDVCRCAKAAVCANERNRGAIRRRVQAQVSGAGRMQAVAPQIDDREARLISGN